MFPSVKVIGLSTGLLVIVSGLFGVSLALARDDVDPPAQKTVATMSPQLAETRVATAATLRSIGIGY